MMDQKTIDRLLTVWYETERFEHLTTDMELAAHYNWAEVAMDNNGILVRSLVGGDDANDWMPVTAKQRQEFFHSVWQKVNSKEVKS